ncbi:MAG: SAF domain-containing protein [Candidatus Melainabacteria bacterium]|nr:SAF domain-containing protein [Candidatus Melainabacteria bacterium]
MLSRDASLFTNISIVRRAKKLLFFDKVARIYLGLVIVIILVYSQLSLPSHAQSNPANSGYYPFIYPTRKIEPGSIIVLASDLAVGKRTASKASPSSVVSPLEILGCRAKRELQKNQAITYQDLDFKTRTNGFLDIADTLKLTEQLRVARSKWSSPSDAYWEFYAPGSSTLEHQGGAVIIATKLLKKGSVILEPTEIERIIVPLSHIPSGAIGSPYRAIGSTAKYDIPKGSVISIQDLIFSSPLSGEERALLRMKFKLAGQKWVGLSVDDFLKNDSLLKL